MASVGKADVTVRPGSQADLEAATAIKVGSWADTYSSLIPPAVLAPFLDLDHALVDLRESTARPDALFLVAEDARGALTGFALAYLEPGPEPWLESLHVASAERGRGVGTALLRELAALLVNRGYRTMSLGVVKGNEGAGRLYSRLGATMVGIEPTDWGQGVDHEVYRWADLAQLARGIYNSAR